MLARVVCFLCLKSDNMENMGSDKKRKKNEIQKVTQCVFQRKHKIEISILLRALLITFLL